VRWITRERVNVDRVACPWLIRKFIDPEAEFFFVPASDIEREAERVLPPSRRREQVSCSLPAKA
jgi:hypothetical protein